MPVGYVWWLLALPFIWLSAKRQNWLFLVSIAIFLGGVGYWRGSVYQQRLAAYDAVVDQKVVIIGSAHSDAVYGRNGQLEFDMRDAQAVYPHTARLLGTLTVSGFGEASC